MVKIQIYVSGKLEDYINREKLKRNIGGKHKVIVQLLKERMMLREVDDD